MKYDMGKRKSSGAPTKRPLDHHSFPYFLLDLHLAGALGLRTRVLVPGLFGCCDGSLLGDR